MLAKKDISKITYVFFPTPRLFKGVKTPSYLKGAKHQTPSYFKLPLNYHFLLVKVICYFNFL